MSATSPVIVRDQLGRVVSIDGKRPVRMHLGNAEALVAAYGGTVECQDGRWIHVPGPRQEMTQEDRP